MSNTSLLGSYGDNSGAGLMFRNRIINGDMRIDQRNSGANLSLGAATEGYPVDRFLVARFGGTATLSTIRQVTTISGATNFEANSAPAGFTHALKVQIGTAQAVGTSNETEVKHSLEGFNGADFAWGTSDAKPVTLSFWVKSSQTGNFGVGMRSATFNYSIVCSYTINAANTWEYKTVVITPPTSGTFHQDNRLHHTLYWDLGVGSSFSTSTLNTWQSTDLRGGLTGGVKLAEHAGATLYITGVQLEAGPTATPFERRPIGMELALCQRYCEVIFNPSVDYAIPVNVTSANNGDVSVIFKQTKRAQPVLKRTGIGNFGRIVQYNSSFNVIISAVTALNLYNAGSDVNSVVMQAVANYNGSYFWTSFDLVDAGNTIYIESEL